MLKQESNITRQHPAPLLRTRSRFVLSKPHKSKPEHPSFPVAPPTFNDPLYEHLDGEVLNREQPNFGPWVEHQRMKSRQRGRACNAGGQLPTIYRPQDTTNRYYQELEAQGTENNQNGVGGLPHIRQRSQRAFSLQNLRPASLEFNPVDTVSQRAPYGGTKTPFFLRMHGQSPTKGTGNHSHTRKSNFIFNYCFHEVDQLKPPSIMASPLKSVQSYLKLGLLEKTKIGGGVSANELLLLELKQHRLNKLKS